MQSMTAFEKIPDFKMSPPDEVSRLTALSVRRIFWRQVTAASRLFSSQTSMVTVTDTQSAMRDNGDGLSVGCALGQAGSGGLSP